MKRVTSQLEAALATVPISNVASLTSVGVPPSDIDPIWDEMRVDVGGVSSGGMVIGATIILRAFDPGYPIDTGAPIPYVTIDGEQYETVSGDPYETVVE